MKLYGYLRTYCDVVMQVRLYAGLSLKSGSRFVFCRFYTGRITKKKESYVTFAEKDGSTTVTETYSKG